MSIYVTIDYAILDFKQYGPVSRWREVVIDKEDYHEVGNEVDGFYAGIRKLYNDVEISFWKSLWPTKVDLELLRTFDFLALFVV